MPWTLLMNPWVILGLLSSLAGTWWHGHHTGWLKRDQQAQLEVAQANDAARQTEQQLTTQINNQATQLRKAQDEVTRKERDLTRLATAGQLRLPAVKASCPAVPTAADAAAPARDRDEAPSELERQTIQALISIAADGDRAAQQAAACIDAYNEVREKLNNAHR